MNEEIYVWNIIYDEFNKPLRIICSTNNTNITFFVSFHLPLMLELFCHNYDYQTELYEYAINYIIDNKIGKYNTISHGSYRVITVYFDIIDKELLLQLI